MFCRLQHSLTGLLALVAITTRANDDYLRVAGPVPLRFQEPARPALPSRPLPPPTPMEQPPSPVAPPVAPDSPTKSPSELEIPEPLGPPAPAPTVPSTVSVIMGSQSSSNSSTNRVEPIMRPITTEGDSVSPQSLIGYFAPRAHGPGRNQGSAVVVAPAVFTPPQPAVTQPSSATYTVKP